MYRTNLFISIVAALSGMAFFPTGAIAMGLFIWMLSSAGVPDRTIWTVVSGIGFIALAVIAFLVMKLMKSLWIVAPNGTNGIKKAISICFHLLLVSAHILLAFAVENRIHPTVIRSPDGSYTQTYYNNSFAVGAMALYVVGCAVIFFMSAQLKPRCAE